MRARLILVLASLLLLAGGPAVSHEGHDHDKPTPLNLTVAPRVTAVTPDFELVGVASGTNRLTVFVHAFETNEPLRGAKMDVSSGTDSATAEPQGDGVFTVVAPWLASAANLELTFELTLSDGTQDVMIGELQRTAIDKVATATPPASPWPTLQAGFTPALVALVVLVSALAGVMATLFFTGAIGKRRPADGVSALPAQAEVAPTATATSADVRPLRRSVGALVVTAFALSFAAQPSPARAAEPVALPSVPSTMATDLAQRLPDSSLFVPKATQHLLSVRTVLTQLRSAPRTVELTGTVISGPEHFGRVQPGRPGRIEAAPGGLAYIGKSVEKGQVLAYVTTYIEAADRANMDSVIAETEARIEKNRTILGRYDKSPGSVPQVKVDEIRGELEALTRKRAELLPNAGNREPVVAPISGVVSVASATIGQIVDARDVLFEIVDPSQFWVEAIAHDPKVARDLTAAHAVTNAGGEPIPLEFAGRGLALRQQASVLTFRITGRRDDLSIGMPVRVVLQSAAKVEGFILPQSAIVRGQSGLPIVWVKTQPERFEPQAVKVDPFDGKSVVVTSGLKEDLRVVTDGVTLLNQVR